MNKKLDGQFYSTISHIALSAGLAMSLSTVSQSASAQQSSRSTVPSSSSIVLDTINVEGAAGTAASDGSYSATSASSPKLTAPLLDTPQTVTVVPQAVIRETGARNLTEVLRNTPGITFDGGENGFGTSTNTFKMRGFDSSGSVFVDGARSSGSFPRDTFNIDRVEVFKGPAADNGRGSAGGYVNMVSKLPSLQNFTSGEVGFGFTEYGNQPQKRGTVDLNHIVAPNTAVRFNGMLEGSGVPGRDVAENKAWGVAPSIAFGLGTDFRAYLAYEHLSRRDRPDWGVPGAAIPGLVTYNPLTRGARRDAFYGLRSDFDNVDADRLLGRVEYDLTPRATVSNQTVWAQVDRRSRFTMPSGFAPPSRVDSAVTFYDRHNQSVSNTTNLTVDFDTGPVNHKVSTGIEFSHETSDADRFGTFGSTGTGAIPALATDLFNPNPDRFGPQPFNPTQRNHAKVTSIAGYIYDTIKLSEQWQITGGLRAEHYTVDIDSRTIAGAPTGIGNFNFEHTTLSGKVGVVYKPVPDGTVYASFGISHLPPGSYLSNEDISRTGDNAFPGLVQGADPVRFHNYEIGTKWDFFNKRLNVAAALFRTEKVNAPITGRDPGETVDSLKGYGKQIVQGVELSVAGAITENWNIFGGVAFIESRREHSSYLDLVRRTASPGDFTAGPGLGGPWTSTNGDELAFTPRVTANLWTTYRIPTTNLTVGGGIQHVGSSYLGRPDDASRIIPNGKYGKLPAYTLVNLMASYEVYKDIHIRFNVDNVADTKYAVATNWAGSRAFLGPARTYRVSTSFKF
jgi:catecholate siderophore receptor